MTTKRFLALGLGLSALHAAMWFACFAVAFGAGMRAFDHPDLPTNALESGAGVLVEILWLPVNLLFEILPTRDWPRHLPDALLGVNSLLWGFAGAALIRRFAGRRRGAAGSSAGRAQEAAGV